MITLGTIKMWNERTPYGRFMLAKSYLRVARLLVSSPPYESEFATAYCVCHAIELTLKSFLDAKSDPASKRGPGGHDLERLLAAAKQAGLHVTVEDEEAITQVAPYARGDKQTGDDYELRYGIARASVGNDGSIFATIEIPHPELLVDVAERLGAAAWPKAPAPNA